MFYRFRSSAVFFVLLVVLYTNGLCADTINVPTDHATIQDAINAASDGDEVVVASETYFETINFNGKAITLRSSSDDPTDTIIDAVGFVIFSGAVGSVVTCESGETETTVLQGFTLTGGDESGMYNENSNPAIINCIFSDNTTDGDGGGMHNRDSNPTITRCTFSNNSAQWYGGGMYNDDSDPMIIDCTFSGNWAMYGGGMYNLYSHPTVTNSTFSGNWAEDTGGGMRNSDSDPTIANCTFNGNVAELGGGMANYIFSDSGVIFSTFSGNSAGEGGGGMSKIGELIPIVINCTFSGNTADQGGGMYNENSNPTITNSVLWGNVAADHLFDLPVEKILVHGNEMYNDDSTPTVTYSCIQGGYEGTGNIHSDPLFIDTQNDDLRLTAESPCIDVGNNAAIPAGIETDLDGNIRIFNDTVDMVAYEVQPSVTDLCELLERTDINCDGVVNILDLAILAAHWLEGSE